MTIPCASVATRYLAGAALALACSGGAAAAQQAGGTITGTLGFDDAVWTIRAQPDLETSHWRETDAGYAIRIVGFPDQGKARDMSGALVLDFTASGMPEQAQVMSARAIYHRPGDSATLSGSGTNVNMTLEALNVTGDDLTVAASFTAVMVPGGSAEQIVEAEDRLTVDANLQATIGRQAN